MSRIVDLDYTNFETLGEIKDKYPDSTIVMRKQFVDMAIEHEWNHGRTVGGQIGISAELNPSIKKYAEAVAATIMGSLTPKVTQELEHLISSLSDEFGRLHVRVTFYKEPR